MLEVVTSLDVLYGTALTRHLAEVSSESTVSVADRAGGPVEGDAVFEDAVTLLKGVAPYDRSR